MTKNEKPMFIRELHIMFRNKTKADAKQSHFGDDAIVMSGRRTAIKG